MEKNTKTIQEITSLFLLSDCYTNCLKSFQLCLDASEFFDEEVAVVFGVQVAQVVSHCVKADHGELAPEGERR